MTPPTSSNDPVDLTESPIEVYRLRSTGVVVGPDESDLGRVGEMYLDTDGKPEWVTVKTGWFDTRECFVPLAGARIDGDDIHVPYDRDTMQAAPHFDADTVLTPADETQLYGHYGLTRNAAPPTPGTAAPVGTPRIPVQPSNDR